MSLWEVLSLTCADSLVPHSLESKLSSTAEISMATNVDGLDAVPTLDFLIMVKKLNRLQLQVNEEASNWQVWFQALLDEFVEMVQVC